MPPSLRKACQACTKSKRRCIPRLPSCERCTQRQICCIYDLEPAVQSQPSPQHSVQSSESTSPYNDGSQLNIVYGSVGTAREASIAAMASGQGINSASARPMLTAGDDVRHWLMTFFSQIARDGLAGKSLPFIHVCSFQELPSTAASLPSSARTQEVMEQRWSIRRRLEEIHSLTTQALSRLLLDGTSSKNDAEVENLVVRLFSATHSLWASAPKRLNDDFEPWEAWIVAESIRRSMFAGILVRGLWYVAAHDYVYYEPFYE